MKNSRPGASDALRNADDQANSLKVFYRHLAKMIYVGGGPLGVSRTGVVKYR